MPKYPPGKGATFGETTSPVACKVGIAISAARIAGSPEPPAAGRDGKCHRTCRTAGQTRYTRVHGRVRQEPRGLAGRLSLACVLAAAWGANQGNLDHFDIRVPPSPP